MGITEAMRSLDIEDMNGLMMAVNSGIPKEEAATTAEEAVVYDYLVREHEWNKAHGWGFAMIEE